MHLSTHSSSSSICVIHQPNVYTLCKESFKGTGCHNLINTRRGRREIRKGNYKVFLRFISYNTVKSIQCVSLDSPGFIKKHFTSVAFISGHTYNELGDSEKHTIYTSPSFSCNTPGHMQKIRIASIYNLYAYYLILSPEDLNY